MTRLSLLSLFVLALASGCSSPTKTAPGAISLEYDTVLARRHGHYSPFVIAKIDGKSRKFFLDSSVSSHTLAKWVYSEALLKGDSGESTTKELRLGDEELGQQHFKVQKLDDFYKSYEIAGYISPAALAKNGHPVLLDLSEPSMKFGAYSSLAAELSAHEPGSTGVEKGVLYIHLTVAGIPGKYAVQLGSSLDLAIDPTSAAAKAVRPFARGKTSWVRHDNGTHTEDFTYSDIPVEAFGKKFETKAWIRKSKEHFHGFDGVIGFPLLRACKIVYGEKQADASCDFK